MKRNILHNVTIVTTISLKCVKRVMTKKIQFGGKWESGGSGKRRRQWRKERKGECGGRKKVEEGGKKEKK